MPLDDAAQPGHPSASHPTLRPAIDAACREIDIDGIGLTSYYVDDAGPGRPLVLLHSINAAPSAFEMRPLFEHYRAQRPVFAPDLPGFGRSARPDTHYSPQRYAAFIDTFLREVVGQPADVVALSLTAEFAARAIADKPGLCRSLTLLSPTGFSKRDAPSGATAERITRFLRLPGIGPGLFRLLTTRISIRYFLGLSFNDKPPETMVDYAHATAHQPGARHAPFTFLSMKLFTPGAAGTLYASLDLPVLVLYDRDPNITFERLEEFRDQPNWRIERISPSMGLPHWEQPDATFRAIDRFWSTMADDAKASQA
jgi:pimeloyl-ACP methyl ester carboxylesterase